MDTQMTLHTPDAHTGVSVCTEEHVKIATDLVHDLFSGKLDKRGYPTELHSFGVAFLGSTRDEFVTGVLHDVLEDTDMTSENLSDYGIPYQIVDAVEFLTRKPKQTYREYISELIESGNKLALRVKINDLFYNIDRIKSIGNAGFSMLNRYTTALTAIRERYPEL